VAATGNLRNDAGPAELASYCVHALTAASSQQPAVRGRGSPARHDHPVWFAPPALIPPHHYLVTANVAV
jgi:hypothetical protein